MGPSAEPLLALAVIAALGGALGRLGVRADAGAAVNAALARLDGPSAVPAIYSSSREIANAD
jgi:hypothetical protein